MRVYIISESADDPSADAMIQLFTTMSQLVRFVIIFILIILNTVSPKYCKHKTQMTDTVEGDSEGNESQRHLRVSWCHDGLCCSAQLNRLKASARSINDTDFCLGFLYYGKRVNGKRRNANDAY